MKEKTINKEQIEMLFKVTESEFRLYQHFAEKFPKAAQNPFLTLFAGYRMAIDILGLSEDYLAYAVHEGDRND